MILICKTCNKKNSRTYEFWNFKTIRCFGREIYSCIITLNDGFEGQMNLKNEIDNFNEYAKLKSWNEKEKKCWNKKVQIDFIKGDKKYLIVLKTKYFQ